jgi:hypothetical protein
MNTIKMRVALKPMVDVVPRSNDKVIELYHKTFPDEPTKVEREREKFIYTYVGSGESPCPSILFMSIQHFTRGIPVEVDDPLVLSKIKTHRSFVEGEPDLEEMRRSVEVAEERADKQRAKDAEMQAWAVRNRA